MADRFGGEVRPGERRVLRDRRGRDDVAQEAAEADRTAAEDRREKSEARREDAEWGRRATERERRGEVEDVRSIAEEARKAALEARTEAKETQRRLDFYLDLDAKLIREPNPIPMLH